VDTWSPEMESGGFFQDYEHNSELIAVAKLYQEGKFYSIK
jgi:hypothetical protein